MSKYTVALRNVLESKSGLDLEKYPSATDVIQAARQHVFNFEYPIFSESYREVLETKILKHFYFREIAFETYGAWHLKLDEKLNLIMPYYNQMYESQGLDFDPFNDTDYEITHTEDTSRVGTYKGENKNIVDEDRTTTETGNSNNTKVTDNTDTVDENTSLLNTHNDKKTGDNSNTLTKGTISTTTNTGTTRKDITEKNEDSGLDMATFTNTDDKNDTQTVDNVHWILQSKTPQGSIDNIEKNGYYSYIEKDTDKNSIKNTGKTITNSENQVEYGKITDSTSTDTRTDNLEERTVDSGTDRTNINVNETNSGDYSNTGTKDVTDTFHGQIVDTGSNSKNGSAEIDRTENGTKKNEENIMTNIDWLRKVTGKRNNKTYSSILLEYRQTFMRIDEMILEELEDLFFLLW